MKSKFLFLIVAAVFLFSTTSCKDYLDVNHTPNAIEEVGAENMLPSVQVKIANQLMGWDMGIGSGFWVQYWSQNYTSSQYKTLCDYDDFTWGTAYSDLTAGALADIRIIQDQVDKTHALWYISECLSIYTWQIITDVWGDIPYTEAMKLEEGIKYPKFDAQQSIYADLLKRTDALVGMDVSKMNLDNKKYDFVFNGDMTQWKRFANSLKLKIMLRLSETPSYDNAAVVSFIDQAISNNLLLLHENAEIPANIWDANTLGKKHPMYEYESDGAGFIKLNIIACKSFIDFLASENDPRIDKLFVLQKKQPKHKGAIFGDYESKGDSDKNGTNDKDELYSKLEPIRFNSMPIPFFSAWEMNFKVAEVLVRAGRVAEAKAYYEAGVTASCAAHGVDGSTMLTSGKKTPWNDGEALERIGLQRWVSFANYQNLEAFLERCRTKFPEVNDVDVEADRVSAFAQTDTIVGKLTISVTGRAKLNGNLPQSLLYPDAIRTRNINAIPQKRNVGVKVWWNQKQAL